MSVWITLSTFATVNLLVGAICIAIYDSFFRYREKLDERFNDVLGRDGIDTSGASPLFRDVRKATAYDSAWNRWKNRFDYDFQQLGIPLTGWQFGLIATIAPTAVVTVGLAYAVTPWIWIPTFVVCAGAPLVYLEWRRQLRLTKLCSQLPRAFDVMSRAVRAGQTVSSAMQIVGEDFESPIAVEFAYCCEQQKLGIPTETTLRDLAQRCAVMELQILVVALLVQNRTGGNLADLLDNLASIVRKRIAFKERVKALTGEGRMQALVLTVLPAIALVALVILAPDYAQTLLDRPWLLGSAAGAQFVGVFWVRSIVNFDS